jgi:hypothetical protein
MKEMEFEWLVPQDFNYRQIALGMLGNLNNEGYD